MTYCFTCPKCGREDDVPLAIDKRDTCISCITCGAHMRRELSREWRGRTTNTGWPLVSNALAVLPSQAGELAAHLRKLGVPTEVTPLGQAVFRDRAHRKRVLRAVGWHDHNAGYGD